MSSKREVVFKKFHFKIILILPRCLMVIYYGSKGLFSYVNINVTAKSKKLEKKQFKKKI